MRRFSRRRIGLVALVPAVALALLTACAERVTTAPDPWAPNDLILGVGDPSAALAGTTWELRALDGDTLPASALRTLRFAPAETGVLTLTTSVGCNRIAGRAQAVGARLRVQELVQTEMACLDPLGRLEARYTALLWEAGYFGVRGDTLWIHDGQFTRRARFEAQR